MSEKPQTLNDIDPTDALGTPDLEAAEAGSTEAETAEATLGDETLTAGQVADLKTMAARAEENWNRYLRAMADLDNYRKRAARERQETAQYANQSLLTRLLPVLDSFEMALAAGGEEGANQEDPVRQGMRMIRDQLLATLAEAGLEEVDATGQTFDPTVHEAVSTLESAEVEEGRVLQQLRKGYRLQNRLLRPATVVVARTPSA